MNKFLIRPAVFLLLFGTLATMGWGQAKSRQHPSRRVATPYKVVNVPDVVPDLIQRLNRWKLVEMPFHSQNLSPQQVQMVSLLVGASHDLEVIYWEQSDPEGLKLIERLQQTVDERNKAIRRFVFINGGRYDLLDDNKPFVGKTPMPPGRALYPSDLTRSELDAYVQAHPEKKAELYSPFTVVRRSGKDLVGVPYHKLFAVQLQSAAEKLRRAATLTDDKRFATFLKMRADALLNDDYYQSDLAWLDLRDPQFDIIFAPYETYLDGMLGVKTSYGAAVMIRNEAESKKLEVYQKHVPDMQQALPLAPDDLPSKSGLATPMEVMDTPYRAGDLNHGYQAVADNLPNDPRIHQEAGTKKIFFKNFMDARVDNVILPVAKLVMDPAQAAQASADGTMATVVMHEISHGLGPAYARARGNQVDIREVIGPVYSGLEEAKADIVGMFCLKWLIDHEVLRKDRLQEYYASYVAGMFRTVRYGTAEAHGRAQMMEFNYLSERKAILRDAKSGRYKIDYGRMPDAVAALSKELLEIEATGDRTRAENWFKKYDSMPAELKIALDATNSVPVDIEPVFSFPMGLP